MKKWWPLLIIFILILSIADASYATDNKVTGNTFAEIIDKLVTGIKSIFKNVVGDERFDWIIPKPSNLRSTTNEQDVRLMWDEDSGSGDINKPVISLISPINTPSYERNAQIDFTCSASDENRIVKIELWIKTSTGNLNLEGTQTEFTDDNNLIASATFTKSFINQGSYQWTCKAYDTNGNSDFGAINGEYPRFTIKAIKVVEEYRIQGAAAQEITPSIPSPPSNLQTGVLSASKIRLTWDDFSSNELGFKIERALSIITLANSPEPITSWEEIAQTDTNTAVYDDENLLQDTTYRYRVRSFNAAGNSAYSNTAMATTLLDITNPVVSLISPINNPSYYANAPIDFTCSASDEEGINKIELLINPPTAINVDDESGFLVEDTKQTVGNAVTVTFTKSFTQVGAYAWNCKANDNNGNVAFGSIKGRSPEFNIQLASSDKEIFVGYRIYRVNKEAGDQQILISNTRQFFGCDRSLLGCFYTDENVIPGRYDYYVKSLISRGGVEQESWSSNIIEVKVLPQSGSGGGGSGGGGGGGGSRGTGESTCTENWLCGDWGECINSKQTRACVDLNNCGNAVEKTPKPTELRSCTDLQAPPDETGLEEGQDQGEIDYEVQSSSTQQIITIVVLVVLIVSILSIVFRKKIFKKGNKVQEAKTQIKSSAHGDYESTKKAVGNAKSQGFSDNDIRKELQSKGWTRDQINEIMKKI